MQSFPKVVFEVGNKTDISFKEKTLEKAYHVRKENQGKDMYQISVL